MFIKINDEIIPADEVKYYISKSETDSYRVEIGNWYNIMGKIIKIILSSLARRL